MVTNADWREMTREEKKLTRAAVKKMYYESDHDPELLQSALEIGVSVLSEGDRDPEELREFRDNAERLYEDFRDWYFNEWKSEALLETMKYIKKLVRDVAETVLKDVRKELDGRQELSFEDFDYYEDVLRLAFSSTHMNLSAPRDEFPAFMHIWMPTDTRKRTRSDSSDLEYCRGLLAEFYCFIREHADRFPNSDEMYRTLLAWVCHKAEQAKMHLDDTFMERVQEVLEEIEAGCTELTPDEELYKTYRIIADSCMYRNSLPDNLDYLDKSYFDQPSYHELTSSVDRCLDIANRNLKRFPTDKEWLSKKAVILNLKGESMYRVLSFSDKAEAEVLLEATRSYQEAARIYLQMEAAEENVQEKKDCRIRAVFCCKYIECIKKKHKIGGAV